MFFKQGSALTGFTNTATSGGTTTLTNASKTIQQFTGSQNHTMQLPDATTLKLGQAFECVNNSTGAITVKANDGTTTLATVAAGTKQIFRASDVSTSNGIFDISAVAGSSSISSADLAEVQAGLAGAFSATSTVVKFNPEELSGDYWLTKMNISTAAKGTFGAGDSVLNNYGYVWGGERSNGTVQLAENERYDDDTNYWMLRQAMSSNRYSPAPFVFGGFGYVAGGSNGSFLATGEKYNDSTNAWSSIANMSTVKIHSGGMVTPAAPYTVGGYTGSTIATTEQYDPTANAWYIRQPLPIVISGFATHTLNGYGYIGMGIGVSTQSAAYYKYNDDMNAWVQTGSSSSGRYYPRAAGVNGLAFNFGGIPASPNNSALVEQYSDANQTWVTKASLPSQRNSCAGFTLNGLSSVISGYENTTGVANTTRVDSYRSSALIQVSIKKRSALIPSAISVYANYNNMVVSTAAQVRTDGENWKNLQTNSDGSSTKALQTLKSKFRETAQVYAAGGFSTTNYKYQEATDSWITRGSLLASRGIGTGWSLDGYGYTAGGITPSFPATNSGDRYNEATDSWMSIAAFTTGISYLQGFAVDGFGYTGPGSQDSTTVNSFGYKYDPTANSWSSVANTNTSKFGPFGFTLSGGGFLAGGRIGTNTDTTDNEYYNVTSNTYTTKGSLTSSKYTGGATGGFSMNGYGYLPGGQVTNTFTGNHQKYDPVADSWANKTSLNTSRRDAAGQNASGFGYIYGGFNGSTLASVEQYNDGTDTWTNKSNMPAGMDSPASIAAGAYRTYEVRIAIPANYVGTGSGGWVSRANIPVAKQIFCGFNLEGFGFTAGGNTGSATAASDRYNRSLDAWSSVGALPSAVLNNNGCVLGGFGRSVNGSSGNTNYKFDPTTYTWSTKAVVPTSRDYAAVFAQNGLMYSAGGGSTGTYQYNDATDSWATKTSVPATRNQTKGASFSGFGYALLGNNGGGVNADAVKYNDSSDSWTNTGTITSTSRGVPGATVMSSGNFLIYGGVDNGSTNYGVVDEYNPISNIGITRNSMTARQSLQGFNLEGAIFAPGGHNGSPTAINQEYAPSLKNALLGVSLEVTEAAATSQSSGFIVATGGTVTIDGNFKVHTFSGSGSFIVERGTGTIDQLLVGGGGSGGYSNSAGGGGGGGVQYNTGLAVAPGIMPVTVGAGGVTQVAVDQGTNGGNSTFNGLTAIGGGAGGNYHATVGQNGGSGGGAGSPGSGFGLGTGGQGNNGGASDGNAGNGDGGGGGGGAGSAGSAGSSSVGGNGGNGVSNSITGSAVTYGGGGGGGRFNGSAGTGGTGGGGNGATSGTPGNGTDGLGGGGGGGPVNQGGFGGKGVVIIRYQYK